MEMSQIGASTFREEAAHDARAVANLFLEMALDKKIELTNLKIQKLMYFAHAECLVKYHRALIRQAFEAWDMGPVIKAAYDQFKKFEGRPIDEPAKAFDVRASAWLPVTSAGIGPGARAVVEQTLITYGRVSAYHLSDLTHQPGSPWHLVRNTPTGVANVGLQISNELIFSCFSHGGSIQSVN